MMANVLRWRQKPFRIGQIPQIAAALLAAIGGLAAMRACYEASFPRLRWLGQPLPVLLLAALCALLGWRLYRRLARQIGPAAGAAVFLPLALNLAFLFNPAVNLVGSRLLLAASLWLAAVLGVRQAAPRQHWRWLSILFALAALLPVYLLTMSHNVGQADTFEFQVVAPRLGIAHPTGYPLYLMLGKLFTLIPLSSVAWRLNFASAVYALAAVALLYRLAYRLAAHPVPALLGAVAFGLTPTFWGQAITAEVYALHALVVAAALWLMVEINAGQTGRQRTLTLLFLLIGLGLTNHLTTVFLLPPAFITLVFAYQTQRTGQFPSDLMRLLFRLALALILPLLLYAYLPLRWAAVNGEPMGLGRFVDWVIGGRFQDALQWAAWLHDPTRYGIVGRLFLNNWGWPNLFLAGIGFLTLIRRQRKAAVILASAWFGFAFYALNYYVPDLAVFLIPAQLVIAVVWAAGVAAILQTFLSRLKQAGFRAAIALLLLLASTIPTLFLTVEHWPAIDQSGEEKLTQWGRAVLNLPLAQGAVILADSEKIAPLFYLQQAEGVRPDLDIMVLPDEAAYRAELDARLAAGRPLYLARFLPGLEGVYHLRSVGPLTEVSRSPLTTLPDTAVPVRIDFGSVQLIGVALEPEAAVDPTQTAVTLYWQAKESVSDILHVTLRLGDETTPAQHPANNYYPTVAWEPGEIVPDFHLLPRPLLPRPQTMPIQVALAPPFTAPEKLEWQTLATMEAPAAGQIDLAHVLRMAVGPILLSGVDFPAKARPQADVPVTLSGYGDDPAQLILRLETAGPPSSLDAKQVGIDPEFLSPFTFAQRLTAAVPPGRYQITAVHPDGASTCGWLAPPTAGCVLGEIEVSGVPLPAGATNFEDKMALLSLHLPDTHLQPGGQLQVELTWQGLAPMNEDYTIFVQVLDAQDRIVGQVDAWPVQGTYPTSQWPPGETITDPHLVPLADDLPPGPYRLQVGAYLLSTLRRLPVLDESGTPVDDKVLVPGLVVP
ncbi:MAG: protein O-mannosyl-transferase family [Anaerolineae bacterium]